MKLDNKKKNPYFDEWISQLDLEKDLEPNYYTVVTWTSHCSPPNADLKQKCLACIDIALWLFYLDDYSEADHQIILTQSKNILLGGQLEKNPPKILDAFHDHFKRMQKLGNNLGHFVQSRIEFIDCYIRRNYLRKTGEQIHSNDYFKIRQVTIYIQQWLDLWEAIGCFSLTKEERFSDNFREIVLEVIKWHVYKNELFSLQRDVIKKDRNLVQLLIDERKLSKEEGIALADKICDDTMDSFTQHSEKMKKDNSSKGLYLCLDFLERCMIGGMANYGDNPNRYNRDSLYELLENRSV